MSSATEQQVDIDLIDQNDRLRDPKERDVGLLAVSMQKGQLQAIKVRPKADGRFQLVLGAHRLEAAKLLKWTTVRALIEELSDDEARIQEIDENLHRVELSPFDQANFIEERRQLWLKLHPESKRGGDRRSKVQIVPLIEELKNRSTISSFLDETARALGVHRMVVKRALFRKGLIAADVWSGLRGTEAETNASLLDKIRKLDPETQRQALQYVRERGCELIEGIRLADPGGEVDAEEAELKMLIAAWSKASESTRKKFIKWQRTAK